MDHRAGDVRHPLRRFRASTGRRDVDQFERANVLKAATWSLPGAILGVLAAGAAVKLGSWGMPAAILLGVAIWAAIFATPIVVAAVSGRAAATLYNPSGRSTPRRREHSHAESLVARGLYDEAVAAFEVAIAEDPSDPEPHLRIARILRDDLGRFEEAARRFRAALALPEMAPGVRVLATRELVELYETKLGTPARAAPLLARMAEEHAGTQIGEWAAEELKRVKAVIAAGGPGWRPSRLP